MEHGSSIPLAAASLAARYTTPCVSPSSFWPSLPSPGSRLNDIANLWPEAAPGFRDKDSVEDYLHARVCTGQLAIDTAQTMIARDWTAVHTTATFQRPGELTAR